MVRTRLHEAENPPETQPTMTTSDTGTPTTDWSWPGNKRLALSIVVNVEEGAEANVADGDRGPEPVDELGVVPGKGMRNFGNESNYRYGINEGAERVFGRLEDAEFPATVTAAAVALERAPHLAQRIQRQGYEVCAHGHRWVHQFRLDEDAERKFIADAVSSIKKTTGRRPYGWLSRYLHTERTRALLVEAGFEYHMDDYSRDEPFWETTSSLSDASDTRPIVIVPYAIDTNDMKFWTSPSLTPDDWLRYAIDTFDVLYAEGAERPRMMSLGLHLRVIGRPGRIAALDRFIAHVKKHNDVWPTTRIEIAQHFKSVQPSPL